MKPLHRKLMFIAAVLIPVTGLTSCHRRSPDQSLPVNRLAKIETISVTGPNGPTHGMLVSVDAADATTFGTLMPSIVATVKKQRTISPPDTSFLLITLIGPVSAAEFKRLWDAHAANDRELQAFLSRLTQAEVLHGTAEGKPLNSASLRQ